MERKTEIVTLDLETTGLSPKDAVVEVGIVDENAIPLVDSLVYTSRRISSAAYNVHGIKQKEIQSAPTFSRIKGKVLSCCEAKDVVIYNAPFDLEFIPELNDIAHRIFCCMGAMTDFLGGKRVRLEVAAKKFGYEWPNSKHRAVSDALACMFVWQHLPEDVKSANIMV